MRKLQTAMRSPLSLLFSSLNQPSHFRCSSCPSRIRLRLSTVDPAEGPQKRPLGTERQTSNLPYPLGLFWEYLAQGRRDWVLCRNWEAICLLGVPQLALILWRKIKRLRSQGTGRSASVSVGTDHWEKDALDDYNLLCRMEANAAFLVSCLKQLTRRLRLQELRHLQPRKKVQGKRKKRRAPLRSLANFI